MENPGYACSGPDDDVVMVVTYTTIVQLYNRTLFYAAATPLAALVIHVCALIVLLNTE